MGEPSDEYAPKIWGGECSRDGWNWLELARRSWPGSTGAPNVDSMPVTLQRTGTRSDGR